MVPNALENLIRDFSAAQALAVRSWWDGLAVAERDALGRLYQNDLPRRQRRVLGRFVEARLHRESEALANVDFYEYLVNHELTLDDGRKFHICSAHPRARDAIIAGVIPAAFECPFANGACPMRGALEHEAGCDLQLRLA